MIELTLRPRRWSPSRDITHCYGRSVYKSHMYPRRTKKGRNGQKKSRRAQKRKIETCVLLVSLTGRRQSGRKRGGLFSCSMGGVASGSYDRWRSFESPYRWCRHTVCVDSLWMCVCRSGWVVAPCTHTNGPSVRNGRACFTCLHSWATTEPRLLPPVRLAGTTCNVVPPMPVRLVAHNYAFHQKHHPRLYNLHFIDTYQ